MTLRWRSNIWALRGHLGTWALGHSSHSGSWTLEALYLADSVQRRTLVKNSGVKLINLRKDVFKVILSNHLGKR